MKESDTYQAILEEGMALGYEQSYKLGLIEGVQWSLLIVGVPHLGEPDAATRQRINTETDVARLEAWVCHALDVESWADLLEVIP